MSKPSIDATANGPYVVSDPPTLRNSKGEELETKSVTALCRCSRSSNKPYCDGTHWKGFKDDKN